MASMDAFLPTPPASWQRPTSPVGGSTGGLRLPSWFHTSLGVAVAVQIGAAAYGIAEQTGGGIAVAVAGCLPFLAVAWVQVARFRRLNGVRVDGFVSRAVLGTSTWSVLAEVVGLGGAVWAAIEDQPGLAAAAAVAGGAGYAASAHLWWRGYQRDPAGHARARVAGDPGGLRPGGRRRRSSSWSPLR